MNLKLKELKKKTPSFDNIMTKLPNRDRLQLTPEQIASIKEDPKAALKQAIIDYSGKIIQVLPFGEENDSEMEDNSEDELKW